MTHGQSKVQRISVLVATVCVTALRPQLALTEEYPEEVLQWGVSKGDSCEDIAKAVYGSTRHAHLVMRYNRVTCTPGAPLEPGTIVLPAHVSEVTRARLSSLAPEVRHKPPGGGWGSASAGQGLADNSSVNTLQKANATIQFLDQTRILLAENTLVVIFGTAAQSAVARDPKQVNADVSVDEGEVKAALAALRGDQDSVEIDVAGGGRVSASSRDTVVAKKGDRTNVSVFDGKSKVTSNRQSVEVARGFGTRFSKGQTPEPARELPKAPIWKGELPRITLADVGQGVLTTSWEPTADAVAYRVEIATDPEFWRLLAREEVGPDVTNFRAENLAPGDYYVRVRVLDKDDFLGWPTEARTTTVVGVAFAEGGGRVEAGGKLLLHPYGRLALAQKSAALGISFDGGKPLPAAEVIEFGQLRPKTLAFNLGENAQRYDIEYLNVAAHVTAIEGPSETLDIVFDGVADAATFSRMRPTLLLMDGENETTRIRLADANFENGTARITSARPRTALAALVVDGWGRSLGSWRAAAVDAQPADQQPDQAAKAQRPLAPLVPAWSVDPAIPRLWAPTAENAFFISAAVEQPLAGSGSYQGLVQVSGNFDALSLEASVRSEDSVVGRSSNEIAWLGGRYRVLEFSDGSFELGPALRFGIPTSDLGPSFQAELGAAAGGRAGMFRWLASMTFDLDGDPAAFAYVPGLALGLMVEPLRWFRAYAALDGYATKVPNTQTSGERFAGGLSVGAEAGKWVFGAVGARATPFESPAAALSFYAALGVRAEP